MLLEHREHEHGAFATFTYSDEHLPRDERGRGVLSRVDARALLRALWDRDVRVPFFLVGEYGKHRTQRPHLHALFFGLEPVRYTQVLERAWGDRGYVDVGNVTAESIAYCSFYCTKKLTKAGDAHLDGKPPEFVRSSRHPPLGMTGLEHIARMHLEVPAVRAHVDEVGDVVHVFRIDGKVYRHHPTMLKHLRRMVGVPELARERKDVPEELRLEREAELLAGQGQARRMADRLWILRNRNGRSL